MKTFNGKDKRIASYKQRKMHLEALLTFVSRKEEFIRVVLCSKNEKDAKERIVSSFNISSEQAQYLLNSALHYLMGLEYEAVQKMYDKVEKYIENNVKR